MNRAWAATCGGVVLAISLVAAGCVARPPIRRPVERPPVQALGLWVRVGPGRAEVVRAERIARARRANAPLLAADRPVAGLSELVVAWWDAEGRPIGSYGFPARGLSMAAPPASKAAKGAPGRPLVPHERYLEVPVPRNAAYAALALVSSIDSGMLRATVAVCDGSPYCFVCRRFPIGSMVVVPESVRVFLLGPDGLPASLPFPPGSPRPPVVLVDGIPGLVKIRLDGDCAVTVPPPLPPADCAYDDGVIGDPVALATGTSPAAERFSVVITGDGFLSSEADDLVDLAKKIADEILVTPPFVEFVDRIDIWLVPAESPKSGIPHCTDDVDRTTVFEVEGEWLDDTGKAGPEGFLGTKALCRIEEAVEKAVAWTDVDAAVVIGNCDVYGGRADFDNKTAYLTKNVGSTVTTERTAIHELGHVIARLGEEYVNCATPDATRTFPEWFPNVAPASEEKTVWWLDLLLPDEEDGLGGFLAIHRCDEGVDGRTCKPKLKGTAKPEMLGWYWGAMYGDAYGRAYDCRGNCDWTDPPLLPSCDYYRPANECTMRKSNEPFCRACERKVREALEETTTP